MSHALYAMKNGDNVLFIALYVDDLIFMGNNDEMIEEFKGTMTRGFEMIDLGLMKFFLGLEIRQVETGIFVSQKTCKRDFEEVQDDKLQPDIKTNGTRCKTLDVRWRRTCRCE
jgi:Reverse transcriptase (RNA-dependent DNA polymerase)